ncbi:MAG: DUF7089 family protein [Natrialbaceae archaeon]
MFTERDLSESVEAVRDRHAPDALVLDVDRDFETLPPAQAEELGLVVDALDPVTYPTAWLPPGTPEPLIEYAGAEFTVGMPGDGGVAWTRQTEPPVVLYKPRLDGSPESFVDFLLAEALVEVGLDEPEHFLGFFADQYVEFADVTREVLEPAGTYQLAAACYDAYLGLQTRDVFAGWEGPLFEAWVDAGERLEPRLADLAGVIARGERTFPEAAELACNAVKHAVEIPPPFDALDSAVYLEHGPSFAVEWADRVADTLDI